MEPEEKSNGSTNKGKGSFITQPLAFIASPAYLVAGFFLIKRFPTRSDLIIPLANWILAVFAIVLGYFAFKGARFTRILVVFVVLSLLCQGALLYYDSQIRTFLSIEWPTMEVPSNEAVVGGSLRNINAADTVLKIYVCVKFADKWACFLDQHANAPSIHNQHWHGQVRLGNEHPDNDHGDPVFFIVVAAVPVDQLSQLPDISKSQPNNASELVNQLEKVKTLAIAGPFLIRKRYPREPKFQFTAIKEQDSQESIKIPKLRAPNYAVCPPVEIMWTGADGRRSVAAVEAWQDGRPHGSAESAFSYRIDKWPENVKRIEVKISSASGKGPYDTITLKRGVCR